MLPSVFTVPSRSFMITTSQWLYPSSRGNDLYPNACNISNIREDAFVCINRRAIDDLVIRKRLHE